MLRIVVLDLEECVGRSSWSDPSRGVITHEHKPSREREGGREGEISVCVVYMLNVCVCVCVCVCVSVHENMAPLQAPP